MHKTRDIVICFSATDFLDPEYDETELPNPHLKEFFGLLGINADPLCFYNDFFGRNGNGEGEAFYFESSGSLVNILYVNLYWSLSDQFDGVTLAVRAYDNIDLVKNALRKFYDEASCQFRYEERNISNEVSSWINKNNYPRIIEESGYEQSLLYKHS
jgi:hypothetical protein